MRRHGCDVTKEGMSVEDAPYEVEQLQRWIDRLEAFASALDDIEGEKATDFANNALEAMQATLLPHIVPAQTPAMLLALEAVSAATRATTTVIMDWADTPDVRNRYTRATAQPLFRHALVDVLSGCKRWLSEGLPPAEEVQRRIAAAAKDVQKALELIGQRNGEMEAEDLEAAADPYGAILMYRDPSVSDAPIFTKVCSFTGDENKRYGDAYDQLRRMLDRELLQHIADESDRFRNVLKGIAHDLEANRIGVFDEDAWDERRRRARSALISFTAALQIQQEQTVNAAKRLFGRKASQVEAIEKLFKELRQSSFEYGWLEELRDALQHGDINAFKYEFEAGVNRKPVVNVYMDREFMLQFTSRPGNKPWLKRRELAELDSDPNVLAMITAIRPLMGPLQETLDTILYPNTANDAATVRELIGRFEGRPGMYAMQTGPGFTRRSLMPPIRRLAPRVLHFAQFMYRRGEETVQPNVVRLGARSAVIISQS
jgi:hypothetical protein